MMKWLLLAAVLGFGVYLGVAVYQDREVRERMREVAQASLDNLHPRYLPRVRRRLVHAARDLGAELLADDIRFARHPTDRGWARAALAVRLGARAEPQLVSLELTFSTRLLGFEQRHRLRVQKVILVEPQRRPPDVQRGAGGPLPVFVD